MLLYKLSIHNLSAGTYRCLHNNYTCLQELVNNALTWQSSCVIANNAQKQQLFVHGYNVEVQKVQDVIKYSSRYSKVHANYYIMCRQSFRVM